MRDKNGHGRAILMPLRSLLVRSALPVLAEQYGDARAEQLFHQAFELYRAEAELLPRELNLGPRLMVHSAALTVALYRSLLDAGADQDEARTLTARVTGSIYDQMAEVPWLAARLSARTPIDRLRRATDVFRKFPFGSPGYEMVDVESGPDTVAFDVRRCPVAEYFRAQDLGELCVESFCNLDFPLAKRWGARLERSTTIAGGAEHCDFRWHVADD